MSSGHLCMVNLDRTIEEILLGEPLDERLIILFCERLKDVLAKESNVKTVSAPVSVVGDIHGQFYDLVELFRIGGAPPDTNYLFLGDYVDRGSHSVETISLLICLKLRYPDRVTMLRGNHESRQITQVYGFYQECVRKYNTPAVWTAITDAFDYLPIAAVINDDILAVHGGLSPSIDTLDQLRILNRFSEIPRDGPISDIMWSDPDPEKEGFSVSPRGAGYVFGHDVVMKFLWFNKLNHICRAHQLCMTGYQLLFHDECMSTVWSAPNYCYRFGNVASIMEVDEFNHRDYNVFHQAPESERCGGTNNTNIAETDLYFI
jgi:serine/threonine-protein phosphatase PPG1